MEFIKVNKSHAQHVALINSTDQRAHALNLQLMGEVKMRSKHNKDDEVRVIIITEMKERLLLGGHQTNGG